MADSETKAQAASTEPVAAAAASNGSVHTDEVAPSTEFRGERDDSLKAHFRFVWVTLLVGCALLEYGFDKSIVGSFQAMVGFLKVFGYEDPRVPAGWNIAAGPQQIISSFMLLGAFISCFAAGPLGSFCGRRWCILLGIILLVASIIIMIITTSLGVLYFSRLMMGFGNGLVMTFTMIYVAELAPSKLRGIAYGFMTTWITAGSAIGLLIADSTNSIDSKLCYQIPLYVLFAMPVVVVTTIFFLPESPRWLLLNGKEDEALKSLTWIRNGAYDKLALQTEFEEMRLNAQHDLETQSLWLVLDLFKGTNLRRTILCVGIGCINPGIGAMFILAFGTYFFKMVGVIDPFKWIVLTQWIGVIGLLLAWYCLDRWGRRTLLLLGSTMCCLSMLVLAIIFTIPPLSTNAMSIAIIFLVSWFQFWFNFGVVPTVYLVSGELPAQNLRAYTSGLSTGFGYVFGWLTTFTAPYFINPAELNWKGKYGYIWFGSSFLVIAFIWFMIPEVQGRSLEEIEEMFNKRLPAKEFPKYVSETAEIARQEARRDLYGDEKGGVMHVEGDKRV
ncbi:general substrate transporter [Podospora aff. communis PSN243]|uniref:General substrate transporter n=1 Tax=Podospora aff. communis PSN243 TaxID=3040156 RepID=A0AAV9G4W8_9PEZI|nr:general substrate transporter [Podospora aff. communis PSN243]